MNNYYSIIHANVAGFQYSLESVKARFLFKLPDCHKKFVFEPINTEIHNPGFRAELKLIVTDVPTISDLSGSSLLCRTDIWELWQDPNEGLVFNTLKSTIPRRLCIDKEYANGTVSGDFYKDTRNNSYPLENLDILLAVNWLAEEGDLMLHASGLILDGKGYAFLGKSGAGKSTLADSLSNRYGAEILGEDQVILRYIDNKFWIFGTPWHERLDRCSANAIPLEAIYFLDRTQKLGKTALTQMEGVSRILQTAFTPFYRANCLPLIIQRLSQLSEVIPFFSINFPLDADVALFL